MGCVLGIDAAWTAHNPSGVALVSTEPPKLVRASPSFEDFVLGTEPHAWGSPRDFRASLRDVLSKAEAIGGGAVTVIAVDMPVAHKPVRARRHCDNAISTAFGARGCSTHSPTMQRPGKVSDVLYQGARAAGFTLKTFGGDGAAPALLEVYPHVALLALCRSERRLPYKLSRRRKNFSALGPAGRLEAVRAQWDGILACLKRDIDITLGINGEIKTLRAWKAWEDVIDAIVCCWVGLEWRAGRAKAYGDENAAIWVPEMRNRGEGAAWPAIARTPDPGAKSPRLRQNSDMLRSRRGVESRQTNQGRWVMPTRVTRDQFEMRENVLVHRPTKAEFTPHPEREGSVVVWTGEIGARLPNGEIYDYGEVLAMMRTVWREMFLTRSPLELTEA